MAIRLAHNCTNCQQLKANHSCSIHEVQVEGQYTCDQFEMKIALKDLRHCGSCSRYHTTHCAHPEKATAGMLCASWAPQATA
ncbi:hypothetical protein [Croceiramulus getboli]|nr:hypothetical protein P8624_00010 [Flavobacteriaceae bacterium YJPT1-3]